MTIGRLFGTDGIRGHISSVILQPESMARLGRILGEFAKKIGGPKDVSITLGRDTRASGIYLEHALIAGISSTGVKSITVGVTPTAAMAWATKLNGSTLGIMISASHNPSHDNGIKIFDQDGCKITESLEDRIEKSYRLNETFPIASIGSVIEKSGADEEYISRVKEMFPYDFFKQGRMVVDCAHGAATSLSQRLFGDHQETTHFIGVNPNGHNINHDCGSEAPSLLIKEVLKHKAQIGIAFDGDADRVIFVDELGQVVDGDAVLALIAIHLKKTGRLPRDTIVTTVMSSVSLDRALEPHGIRVIRTDVGDKFIARIMNEQGLVFGGENSGHLLFFPQNSTGDGIYSALVMLDLLQDKPLSKLAAVYRPTPRLLKNIVVTRQVSLMDLPQTRAAITEANERLNGVGRVLFRYSGTENKARLLVEAVSKEECFRIANEIARLYSNEMSLETVS